MLPVGRVLGDVREPLKHRGDIRFGDGDLSAECPKQSSDVRLTKSLFTGQATDAN